MRIPRVLSADAATLSARNLVESLLNPTPNAPFATIDDTHHAALRSLADLFNIIPKSAEQQSTKRHNVWHGKRQEEAAKPDHVSAPVTP